MIKFFVKIWRYFFPLPAEDIEPVVDPRFEGFPSAGWHKMRRVYCPRCGSPTQMIGDGKINDKVRCAKRCGMRGYFDGIHVKWNYQYWDRN